MAKLYATEMLARVTDQAVQIFGGMGLMEELPIERFWRDARVERIWDGTSRDPAPHHLARAAAAARRLSVATGSKKIPTGERSENLGNHGAKITWRTKKWRTIAAI